MKLNDIQSMRCLGFLVIFGMAFWLPRARAGGVRDVALTSIPLARTPA